MITPEAAYDVIKKKYDLPKILSCLEFDNFYLFSVAPALVNTSNGYFTGTTFDAIDKKSGKHFYYDISTDLDAFENAKSITISTFLDRKV